MVALTKFKVGDPVIFRTTKYSTHPGPRARRVMPSPHGEFYTYQVDKFWLVVGSLDDGHVVVQTRRGKQHTLPADAEDLRAPSWWERLLYRRHFPKLEPVGDDNGTKITQPT